MDINNLTPSQLSDFLQEYGTEIEHMNHQNIHGSHRQRHIWNWIPDRYRDMEYPTYKSCKKRKTRLLLTLQKQIQKYLWAKENRKGVGRRQEDGWLKYPRGQGELSRVEMRLYAAIQQRYSEILMEDVWGVYFERQREVIEKEFRDGEEKH